MKCDKCNKYIDKDSKYCSNCGSQIKQHKIHSIFTNFINICLLISMFVICTKYVVLTKSVFLISIWLLFLVVVIHNIIINKLIYYFTDYKNPNVKLLDKLFALNILKQQDLFVIDYIRLEKGWKSLFNNGQGLIIKCENNEDIYHEKNEIQSNFINQMKNKKL